VSVVVDAAQPLEQLAATAREWGTSVDVLVEINAGQDRWGCRGCSRVLFVNHVTFVMSG
jgi:D-serine deaminase-like pyridoxal phosphate-dependent protein